MDDDTQLGKLLIKIANNSGPSILPCGTPEMTNRIMKEIWSIIISALVYDDTCFVFALMKKVCLAIHHICSTFGA